MSFIESPRFPEKISYGSSGGPSYSTDVITVSSGHERRNQNWVQSRHKYDAAFGVVSEPRLSELIEYFHAMAGKANEFRYKDWGDYLSCDLQSIPSALDQQIGVGDAFDGSPTDVFTGTITSIQSQRTSFADNTRTDPDDYFNTFTLNFTSGSNAGLTALVSNYTSAIGSFVIDSSNLTNDLTVGDAYSITRTHIVDFQLIKTYTQGLSRIRDITKPIGVGAGNTTVLVAVDGVIKTEGAHYILDYTTGIITFIPNNIPLIGEIVTAGYEFDVPCRFDTDELNINFEAYSIGNTNVPIIEVRI